MELKFSLRALIIAFLTITASAFAADTGIKKDSLYQAKSKWTTPEGKTISLSELRGQPVLITMVYTKCQFTCPLIISKLKNIESALKSNPKLKIVMVSFDQKNDTPENMTKFMQEKSLDPSRWLLLAGTSTGSVRELATLLEISYKQEKNGEYSHSNVLTLLDKEGVKRTVLNGIAADHAPIVKSAQELL